jgi:hypothetical protein
MNLTGDMEKWGRIFETLALCTERNHFPVVKRLRDIV